MCSVVRPSVHPDDVLVVPASRILVVDDEVAILGALVELLALDGHVVAGVADGVEALERLDAFRPDVVVTDWMMPRLDGRGLVLAMRADEATRAIPVIVLSAVPSPDLRGLDPVRFLRKPMDIDVLTRLIRLSTGT